MGNVAFSERNDAHAGERKALERPDNRLARPDFGTSLGTRCCALAWPAPHRRQPVVDDSGCVELLPLVNNWQQFDTSLVVCRGFSDAIEGGPSSLDLGDDVVDGLGPHEGFRVVVPV